MHLLPPSRGLLSAREDGPEPAPANIPMGGRVISMILSLVTVTILAICTTRRIEKVGKWSRLPITGWLIIIIYCDSFLFVFVTAMFKDIGINESDGICEGAILLCLVCYMSTKIFIYIFLVEKAYIVRGSHKPRLHDKLYVFNAFGLMVPYTIIVILNFVWRIAYINPTGTCIIGMEKKAMMPLIIFDVVLNVYLTALFIIPLRRLYSYQHNTNKSLRVMALRTFIGSCATLTSSVVNLTVLMVLKGEPGWICLMCCNADILFSVLVLHWVTSFDKTTTDSSYARQQNRSAGSGSGANGTLQNGSAFRHSTRGSIANGDPYGINGKTKIPSPPQSKLDNHLPGPRYSSSGNHGGPRAAMTRSGANGGVGVGAGGWDSKGSVKTQCCAERPTQGKPNPEDIALDRIVVKTEQIREVENGSDRSSDTTVGGCRDGGDYGPSGGYDGRNCNSTDGIVDQV